MKLSGIHLQYTSWHCQKLTAEQLLPGQAVRTVHHNTYKTCLLGHSPPAKLGRTPCWASPRAFGIVQNCYILREAIGWKIYRHNRPDSSTIRAYLLAFGFSLVTKLADVKVDGKIAIYILKVKGMLANSYQYRRQTHI
jgi:hypothetical protein